MSFTKQFIHFLVKLPALTGGVIFLLLLVLAYFFIKSESDQIIAEQKISSLGQVGVFRAQIERDINSVLAVLKALKAEVAVDMDLSEEHFPTVARELLLENKLLTHLNIAPDLTIKYIFPSEGKEHLIGTSYNVYSRQMPLIQEAIKHRNLAVSPPQVLSDDSTAIVARYPIFIETDEEPFFWGIVSALIDQNDLFAALLNESDLGGYRVAVGELGDEGGMKTVFVGDSSVLEQEPVIDVIQLPIKRWFLAATPVEGWSVPSSRLWMMWGLSVVVSGFIACGVFLLGRVYNDKTRAVNTANYRANYDVLTGLPNRYHFSQRLNSLIREVKREEQGFAVFFIDIDYFKQINDSAGHAIGDQLLIEFSDRLKQSARDSDIVARLAGDEFVVVLRNIEDVIQADLLAEKMQKKITQPFNMNNRQYSISASMGIAMYPLDGDDVSSLLLHSDQAMYAAKRAGRNGYFFFNEGMQDEAEHFLDVHNNILKGIQENQFVLHYQPIMSLNSGRIVKCEALIRWKHPDKGLMQPDEFIPIAERTGAIRELGNWVLKQACKDQRKFMENDIDIQIAINRSVNEFYSTRAYEKWKAIIRENGIDCRKLVFEITESLFMDKHVNRINVVSALRKMGIEFAVDDFGTGYSAINYLRSYPVNYLKIDKSFIQDLLHDEQDRTLVEVIVKMGTALNIGVIAEGVENDGQVDVLRSFGCEYIQGYWLAPALPIEQAIAFCQDAQDSLLSSVRGTDKLNDD
ncbi:putative bifunctional diguanylate cyclase/phosphodiesterase [Neptunomonas phycophila]|uniref:putative bifunctional diguanylate cyclase/phosphodiesterase n=1 Tax=Neptunomonas phycophila TaxID=1572645 RepID=UPI0023F62187|nr:EAL domain-containing protein [Neptunomonas phycophila]